MVAGLLTLVLVLFFGSNLVMRSGWFRGKLAGRLALHTRLSWTVEEASWSPWGGGRIGGLTALAGGTNAHTIPPICEIAEIRVQPYWQELLAGRVRIRELRVSEPRGRLPLELLVQMMKSDGRVDTARLGLPGIAKPASPAPEPGAVPEGTRPKPPAGGTAAAEPALGAEDGPRRGERVESKPEVPEAEPSSRLIVEGGDVGVYTMAAPGEMLRLIGLHVDLPIGGGESDGVLEAVEVTFAGAALAGPVTVPVRWKEGVIECPAGQFESNGLTVQTAGAVRIRGRLSGRIEIRVIGPKMDLQPVPGWESAKFATGPMEMRLRLSGDPARPVTWQGNLVAEVRGVRFVHPERGELFDFEQARLVTDLRGGVLNLVDGALVGERLSFFSNGLMVLDGRVYGVGRVVAAPDVAEEITRVAAGAMVTPGYVETWMSPLVTPDRYYRDIYARGTVQKSEFDLGPAGQWMDTGRALQLMRMFVKREEAEELGNPKGKESDES